MPARDASGRFVATGVSRIVFNEGTLNKILNSPGGPVAQRLLMLGYRVEAAAKSNAPVDTGRLAGSITTILSGGMGGIECQVGTNVEYAIMVHEGTRAHTIVPRSARMLRFESRGGVVFARRVNHPGTAGRPFLVQALGAIG